MAKHKDKEVKTNAMRILDKNKISYETINYECDEFIDGLHTAEKTGAPVEQSFKTLVAQGKSKEYYVLVIPIAEEVDLKKAAKVLGEKSIEMIHVNDITKVIPALSNVITANGDEGLITARLGEMILPEKPVKNLVPDFISNVEKANAMMKNGGMGDINIENNLIVQGSIDKDTFPGVKKMQEMSYDYIVKQLTDQRQKSGYKTKL